jgi:SAM-dependent methyltransferase
MIHHVPYPTQFFEEMRRILKPGGVLLIQEINASFFMRLVLRIMRHEGYSYDVNVFDADEICTDANDLWSANCAIPNLLFDDMRAFEKHFPYFKVEKTGFSEFFLLLNSGGVISKSPFIPLPYFVLHGVRWIDNTLTRFLPSIFAMQRQLVLRKLN